MSQFIHNYHSYQDRFNYYYRILSFLLHLTCSLFIYFIFYISIVDMSHIVRRNDFHIVVIIMHAISIHCHHFECSMVTLSFVTRKGLVNGLIFALCSHACLYFKMWLCMLNHLYSCFYNPTLLHHLVTWCNY